MRLHVASWVRCTHPVSLSIIGAVSRHIATANASLDAGRRKVPPETGANPGHFRLLSEWYRELAKWKDWVPPRA